MAWTEIEWACGHYGQKQLYGKTSAREATVAYESGRDCMMCWLINEWKKSGDPRSKREDRYSLAASVAKGKGIRIDNVPEDVQPEEKETHNKEAMREILSLQSRYPKGIIEKELTETVKKYIAQYEIIKEFKNEIVHMQLLDENGLIVASFHTTKDLIDTELNTYGNPTLKK